MSERPADITLPEGWTWERVETQRAKWSISDTMVPVANAPGVTAWATINSVRIERCDVKVMDGDTFAVITERAPLAEVMGDDHEEFHKAERELRTVGRFWTGGGAEPLIYLERFCERGGTADAAGVTPGSIGGSTPPARTTSEETF